MTDSSSGEISLQGIVDEVQDLLVVPQDHILALPREKWHHFAMELEEEDKKSWKRIAQEHDMDHGKIYKFLVSLRLLQ